MKILNRFTGETIFECAAETMRETVFQAIKQAANLSGADLSGAYLSGAYLTGANLRAADLTGANLSAANLSGAYLSAADLRAANLSAANLRGANLSAANLSAANLRGANLTDANLTGADLTGADLTGANLRAANLRAADLSGANLSGANLRGANLPVLEQIEKTQIRSSICKNVCDAPEKLDMRDWHVCDTVHCIAGWTVVLHPQGRLLESIYGTSAAAALILWVCEGEVPDFHTDNETAMRWIRG